MKVPERFLGYAFCFGDILVEMDANFSILNADGAVNSLLGNNSSDFIGNNILDYFAEIDRELIKRACATLTGKNRLGPIKVRFKVSKEDYESYVIFLTRLPIHTDRFYMVISRQYRLGLSQTEQKPSNATVEEKRTAFLENMESIFTNNDEAAESLLVTVMESLGEGVLSQEHTAEIERYLSGFSLGGNSAAQLEDNKFAIIHERSDEEAGGVAAKISDQISAATGLELSSATIDAKTAGLTSADSVKALAFSLQQFANGNSDFGIENFAEDPVALLGETTEKVTQFRHILDTGAFSLVFQPIVDLNTNKVHHFEALSRFEKRDTLLSPFELITFAENVGLIAEFDMSVLNRTLTKLRTIHSHGAAPMLAVNVSGKSLSGASFMDDFTKILKENFIFKDSLCIEITESSKIDDLDVFGEQLDLIRKLGFKVYLDDFGSGVSGFQYLRKLKVDALKIDGMYIKDALTSQMDRAFLKAMVALCQDLQITTVGEWVETKEHADLLRSLGVDYGQGYYFGKPKSGIGAKAAE